MKRIVRRVLILLCAVVTGLFTAFGLIGCGDSYVEITAAANGHNTDGATWVVASEKLVSGRQCTYKVTEETTCTNSNCSETITRTLADPIHKGDYTSEITKQANCTDPGEITYTCSCKKT